MRKAAISLLMAAMAASAAEPARKIFPYPYVQEDLPNGLRLVTVPDDFPNIVALYIVVGTGSRNEIESGKSGFAHLFEHLMFRGTKEFPPDKYQSVLNRAGAASNAFTTDDFTCYHTTFSKEDLPGILAMEADRFQHLDYTPEQFKTETQAVLGEYNKNSANPISKMFEALRARAFQEHTYRHTTMGFLKDIQNMPNEFDYSRQFFDRYYRPEYTTIIVVGDVEAKAVRALVDKNWGAWKRGSYKAPISAEPPQEGPRTAHVDWPTATLPWLAISFRGPAYTDTATDSAALDALSFLAFSRASDLYQKLVITQQKVDVLGADNSDHVDPYLFSIFARVKKQEDVEAVEKEILATAASFAETPVSVEKLNRVKDNLRYSFALRLNDSEAIAGTVASYVALRRTPETINLIYDAYAKITPDDVQKVAQKYLKERNRTIVTLTGAAK
jgi:zinc protease